MYPCVPSPYGDTTDLGKGASYRRHGVCTCRNNPSWPHCSVCQDTLLCAGCKFCDPDYVNDTANETRKGAPWPEPRTGMTAFQAHDLATELRRCGLSGLARCVEYMTPAEIESRIKVHIDQSRGDWIVLNAAYQLARKLQREAAKV